MSNPAVPAIRPSMAIFDEIRWVIQIRKSLEEEHEQEQEIPVCIFNVPKTLMTYNPEFYVPQLVSIGPYHHWRQEINEMERYKLAAAKRTQKRYHNRKFNNLVDELMTLEPRIRCCYHKFLDCNSETLAWMMAVDLSFLLEVLQCQASTVKEGKSLNRVSSSTSHLIDSSGRKSAYNAILRDIIMLENQVPLFVLRKMLEFEHSSLELADEVLSSMLFALCRELSPFNMEDVPSIEVCEISHLLDFLYQAIVPKCKQVAVEIVEEDDGEEKSQGKDSSLSKPSYVRRFFDGILKLLKLLKGPLRYLKKVLLSKPLKLLVKLPWIILSKLPGISLLVKPFRDLFFPEDEEEKPEDSEKANRPPLIEEIMIPSVTELYNAGVRFLPSHGDIKSISFDTKTCTFLLPAVSLDVNTEVVLRNLVAYEATADQGALIFTRYTELMNGIIDTEEDAKLLREKGIVFNYLKSDQEVADIWNGMSKSVRLTRVPWLDNAIKDVNKYYCGRWKVKLKNFVTVYVFGSWKFLVFLAAVFLLLLMTLQAFCSVYTCSRILHTSTSFIPTNE